MRLSLIQYLIHAADHLPPYCFLYPQLLGLFAFLQVSAKQNRPIIQDVYIWFQTQVDVSEKSLCGRQCNLQGEANNMVTNNNYQMTNEPLIPEFSEDSSTIESSDSSRKFHLVVTFLLTCELQTKIFIGKISKPSVNFKKCIFL